MDSHTELMPLLNDLQIAFILPFSCFKLNELTLGELQTALQVLDCSG
jgi:hypothetical protein